MMRNRSYLSLLVCALLCALAWTAYAQGQKLVSNRTAWDYKFITYISQNQIAGLQAELYEDGKKLPTPDNGSLAKVKELGDQGWELVTVAVSPVDYNRWDMKYYFKRAK